MQTFSNKFRKEFVPDHSLKYIYAPMRTLEALAFSKI